MAGLVEVKVHSLGQGVGQVGVPPADVQGQQRVGAKTAHGVQHFLVAGCAFRGVQIGIATQNIHRVKPGKGFGHLAAVRFHQCLGQDVARYHPRSPGARHIVAPQHHQRRSKTIGGDLFTHVGGMVKIVLVHGGAVIKHTVRLARPGHAWCRGPAAVPLGQNVDLQHVEPLLAAQDEVTFQFLVGHVGEGAPQGIGQPEEGLAVPLQAAAVIGYGQFHTEPPCRFCANKLPPRKGRHTPPQPGTGREIRRYRSWNRQSRTDRCRSWCRRRRWRRQ